MDPWISQLARHRWLKRPLRAWLPRATSIRLKDGFRLFVDPRDERGPSFHVLWGKEAGFENYESLQREALLKHLPPNGVFLDIGANVGLFSFYFARKLPHLRIHAFEPHPLNAECFRSTLAANRAADGLALSIELHACAVGAEPGRLQLFIDQSDAGGHSLLRSTLGNNRGETESVAVEVVKLDEWAERTRLDRVDAIKIDVQGAEDAALRGARGLIARHRPAILVEIQNAAVGEIGFAEWLHELGYRVRPVGQAPEEGFLPLPELRALARRRLDAGRITTDYLFTP